MDFKRKNGDRFQICPRFSLLAVGRPAKFPQDVPDGVDQSSRASKIFFSRSKGSSEFPLTRPGFSGGVLSLESSEGRGATIFGVEGSTAASGGLIRTVSRGGASGRCSAVDVCGAANEVSAGFSPGVLRR